MFVLPLFCIQNAAERHVLATCKRGKEPRNCVAFVWFHLFSWTSLFCLHRVSERTFVGNTFSSWVLLWSALDFPNDNDRACPLLAPRVHFCHIMDMSAKQFHRTMCILDFVVWFDSFGCKYISPHAHQWQTQLCQHTRVCHRSCHCCIVRFSMFFFSPKALRSGLHGLYVVQLQLVRCFLHKGNPFGLCIHHGELPFWLRNGKHQSRKSRTASHVHEACMRHVQMRLHGGKERQGIQDVSREGFFRIADGAHPTCTCQGGREISQTHLRGSVEGSESRGCISHACKRRTWTQGRRHGGLGPLQLDQPWSRAHGFHGEGGVDLCWGRTSSHPSEERCGSLHQHKTRHVFCIPRTFHIIQCNIRTIAGEDRPGSEVETPFHRVQCSTGTESCPCIFERPAGPLQRKRSACP